MEYGDNNSYTNSNENGRTVSGGNKTKVYRKTMLEYIIQKNREARERKENLLKRANSTSSLISNKIKNDLCALKNNSRLDLNPSQVKNNNLNKNEDKFGNNINNHNNYNVHKSHKHHKNHNVHINHNDLNGFQDSQSVQGNKHEYSSQFNEQSQPNYIAQVKNNYLKNLLIKRNRLNGTNNISIENSQKKDINLMENGVPPNTDYYQNSQGQMNMENNRKILDEKRQLYNHSGMGFDNDNLNRMNNSESMLKRAPMTSMRAGQDDLSESYLYPDKQTNKSTTVNKVGQLRGHLIARNNDGNNDGNNAGNNAGNNDGNNDERNYQNTHLNPFRVNSSIPPRMSNYNNTMIPRQSNLKIKTSREIPHNNINNGRDVSPQNSISKSANKGQIKSPSSRYNLITDINRCLNNSFSNNNNDECDNPIDKMNKDMEYVYDRNSDDNSNYYHNSKKSYSNNDYQMERRPMSFPKFYKNSNSYNQNSDENEMISDNGFNTDNNPKNYVHNSYNSRKYNMHNSSNSYSNNADYTTNNNYTDKVIPNTNNNVNMNSESNFNSADYYNLDPMSQNSPLNKHEVSHIGYNTNNSNGDGYYVKPMGFSFVNEDYENHEKYERHTDYGNHENYRHLYQGQNPDNYLVPASSTYENYAQLDKAHVYHDIYRNIYNSNNISPTTLGMENSKFKQQKTNNLQRVIETDTLKEGLIYNSNEENEIIRNNETPELKFDQFHTVGIEHVMMMKNIKNIRDKAKSDVIQLLLDGEWHNEKELLRIAKRSRFIGSVGFGMMIYSINEMVSVDFIIRQKGRIDEYYYKIKDNYIGMARAAFNNYSENIF
ncbi:MAG: hypothetical protein ACTSU2_09340 [Promethearchaeota archaeon]